MVSFGFAVSKVYHRSRLSPYLKGIASRLYYTRVGKLGCWKDGGREVVFCSDHVNDCKSGGMLLAIKGFSAAMLGGMGSFVGAVIGGFVFSFLESFAATFISGSLKEIVTFIVIINVLLFMPRGIMGPRMREGLEEEAVLGD